jgi:hypothetical protein
MVMAGNRSGDSGGNGSEAFSGPARVKGGWRAHAVQAVAGVSVIVAGCAFAVTAVGVLHAPAARVLSGGRYGFDNADGVAFSSGRAWVINGGDNSVTEMNAADGQWIRTVSVGRYGVNKPSAIVADGAGIWVLSVPEDGISSLAELSAAAGAWVRTLSGHGLGAAVGIAADGSRLWVAADPASGAGTVIELNAADGSWIRTVTVSSSNSGSSPDAIATDGSHIWVVSSRDTGGSLTELDPADASIVRTLPAGRYDFDNPSAVIAEGGHVWVTSDPPVRIQDGLQRLTPATEIWCGSCLGSGMASTHRSRLPLAVLTCGSLTLIRSRQAGR